MRACIAALLVTLSIACAEAQTPDAGRNPFRAHCVGCHGEDGAGGGHGADIVNISRPRGISVSAVREIILTGIPDAGMPAFQIPVDQAEAIAQYVMLLKAPAGAKATTGLAPGDPAAGERFFAGKGNCTSCHMVRGRGGVLGPDLSNIGGERGPSQIEQALINPGGAQSAGGRRQRNETAYRAVTVRLRNGQSVRGLVKNESAFDLQLLSVDGTLRLLLKNEVADVTPEKSLMPKLVATANERQDLVAYLSRLTMDPGTRIVGADEADAESGISFADVAHPRAGTWPTYHGNESGNRFSPLDQINTRNVEKLAPKWMFMVGAPRGGDQAKRGVPSWAGLEVTPVVVDGVMYVTSVNEMYALDARSGREIWHYVGPARRVWQVTRRAVSTAAWRCSATACSWSRITRISSRSIVPPASFCGM